MAALRLPVRAFELGGKTYQLVLNMNVFADLQEAHDGNLLEVLDSKNEIRASLEILAAMLNEANDVSGDPERFTARSLGRTLGIGRTAPVRELVRSMLSQALAPDEEGTEKPESTDEEDEKN